LDPVDEVLNDASDDIKIHYVWKQQWFWG